MGHDLGTGKIFGGNSTPPRGVPAFDADTWDPVPKWHLRRLFGYKWRRREYRYDDHGDYYYRTDKQLAREHLHNTFGPKRYDPGEVDLTAVLRGGQASGIMSSGRKPKL